MNIQAISAVRTLPIFLRSLIVFLALAVQPAFSQIPLITGTNLSIGGVNTFVLSNISGIGVFGNGNTIYGGDDSVTIGSSNTCYSYNSAMIGQCNYSVDCASCVIGYDNTTSNNTGIVVGSYNTGGNNDDETGSLVNSAIFGSFNLATRGYNCLISGENNCLDPWDSADAKGCSAAIGMGLCVCRSNHIVVGMYNTDNTCDSGPAVFTVGNGTSSDARHNALVVRKNGATEINGSLIVTGSATVNGSPLLSQAAADTLYLTQTAADTRYVASSGTAAYALASSTAAALSGTLAASKVSGLAPVAISGNYSDLNGKPSIPTDLNQLANASGFITASGTSAFSGAANYSFTSGTASFAQTSATAAILSGTIPASQVSGLLAVATGGNLDYSKLNGAPTNISAFANDAGYVASNGTASNLALSGTTSIAGTAKISGGIVVTGTMDNATNTVVASGTNQLVLLPQQGDLSMGTFTGGALPQ